MKKIKGFVKKNYKVVISFILGMIVCIGIGVSAVATKDIIYDNSKSGLTSTNLQGAIDELNTKATTKIEEAKNECPEGYKCIKQNIVAAYTYNSSSCITGEESTCVQTSCYENKTSGSCPAGTIIKYAVNDSEEKYFHVLHDDGETMTLQQRENTVYNTAWYSPNDNRKGPLTILPVLENATSGWTNVNNQTYTMGTTTFKTNAYTGCTSSGCTTNTYTLGERTAKARMITMQEALSLGCTKSSQSCPNWMNNYLNESTSYGGTVNDTTGDHNYGYWTMSANSSDTSSVWYVDSYGSVGSIQPYPYFGARAVVVVSK